MPIKYEFKGEKLAMYLQNLSVYFYTSHNYKNLQTDTHCDKIVPSTGAWDWISSHVLAGLSILLFAITVAFSSQWQSEMWQNSQMLWNTGGKMSGNISQMYKPHLLQNQNAQSRRKSL